MYPNEPEKWAVFSNDFGGHVQESIWSTDLFFFF
jgi:hypothetical protein